MVCIPKCTQDLKIQTLCSAYSVLVTIIVYYLRSGASIIQALAVKSVYSRLLLKVCI